MHRDVFIFETCLLIISRYIARSLKTSTAFSAPASAASVKGRPLCFKAIVTGPWSTKTTPSPMTWNFFRINQNIRPCFFPQEGVLDELPSRKDVMCLYLFSLKNLTAPGCIGTGSTSSVPSSLRPLSDP